MELKRRLSPKYVFIVAYFACLAFYVAIGLSSVKATEYDIAGKILIPSIGLHSDVTNLALTNGKIETPDDIVGSYSKYDNKTLLIGHSGTVFHDLNNVSVDDYIIYGDKLYRVVSSETFLKSDISMNELLRKSPRDTLLIMTFAGEAVGEKDATHRLILTAIRV